MKYANLNPAGLVMNVLKAETFDVSPQNIAFLRANGAVLVEMDDADEEPPPGHKYHAENAPRDADLAPEIAGIPDRSKPTKGVVAARDGGAFAPDPVWLNEKEADKVSGEQWEAEQRAALEAAKE